MKNDMLLDYIEKAELLFKDLYILPKELISYIPDIEDAWSIERHLRHLFDVELNQFWALNDGFVNHGDNEFKEMEIEDFTELLKTYRKLRKEVFKILLNEDLYQNNCRIKSSVHGIIELEFEEGLKALNNHLDVHKDFIKRNIEEYR